MIKKIIYVILSKLILLTSCQKKMNINPKEFYENSDLEMAEAIISEDLNLIQQIIKTKNVDVNTLGLKKMPFLVFAALNNNIKSFEELLKMNADPNIKIYTENQQYIQPLAYLITIENFKYIELLLKYGANPNSLNAGKHSFFYLLYVDKQDEGFNRIVFLIKNGADINVQQVGDNLDGETITIAYCTLDRFDFVEKLIELDANSEIKDGIEMTALHYIQKQESVFIEKQRTLKKKLIERGIKFPIVTNIAVRGKTKQVLDAWFTSKEGINWKNKLETFALDYKMVGREWNIQQDAMMTALREWMEKENIQFTN